MKQGKNYDHIRPYYDHEAYAVMQRIKSDPLFRKLAAFIWPGITEQEIEEKSSRVRSISDFQMTFMNEAIQTIVARTSNGLSSSGFEKLDPGKAYLFISNHRDILLDSAILQVLLVKHRFPTSEITFGNNLTQEGFISDFGKINRMFSVKREGTPRELYEESKNLSDYIRHTITEKRVSVWLAQRNGRTKDGSDETQTGLLKMLNISGGGTFEENFREIAIVPVSISYEREPCEAAKAREVYLRATTGRYEKAPGEDMQSIINGVLQQKGRIHLTVGAPIDPSPVTGHLQNENEKTRVLAAALDAEIHSGYRLWPGNFIAADELSREERFASEYSDAERTEFKNHIRKQAIASGCSDAAVEDILWRMYANPVFNKFHLNMALQAT